MVAISIKATILMFVVVIPTNQEQVKADLLDEKAQGQICICALFFGWSGWSFILKHHPGRQMAMQIMYLDLHNRTAQWIMVVHMHVSQ